MLGYVTVYISGLLFALGLGISGMTLPQKVLAFLDVAGPWDPSLALVMLGSVSVYLIMHRWILRMSHPLFDTSFHLPSTRDIDGPLVIGSALFGIGWGIVGLCPGPAVTALAVGTEQVFIFFVAMAMGMYLSKPVTKASKVIGSQMTAVDG